MTPITFTEGAFQSLAAAVALRQLSRYGVPERELATHGDSVVNHVERCEEKMREVVAAETSILRSIPESKGEDRNTAELILMLAIYSELGCRIADTIQRKRVAERN